MVANANGNTCEGTFPEEGSPFGIRTLVEANGKKFAGRWEGYTPIEGILIADEKNTLEE